MGSRRHKPDCSLYTCTDFGNKRVLGGLDIDRIVDDSAEYANLCLEELFGVNGEQLRAERVDEYKKAVKNVLCHLFGGKSTYVTEAGYEGEGLGCSMPSLKKQVRDVVSVASRLSSEQDAPFKPVKVNVVQREPGTADRYVRRIDDPLLNLNRIDPRWLYQDVDTFRPLLRAPSVFIPDLSMLKLLGSMVPEIKAQFFSEARGARRIFGPRLHMPNLCNSSVCSLDVCDPEGCNPDVCNLGICNTIVYSPHAYLRDPSEHGRQRAASQFPPGLNSPVGAGVQQAVDAHLSSLFSNAIQISPSHNHTGALGEHGNLMMPMQNAPGALQSVPPQPHAHPHQNHTHHQGTAVLASTPHGTNRHIGAGGHVHQNVQQQNSNSHGHSSGHTGSQSDLPKLVSGEYNAGLYNVNVYNSNIPQGQTPASACRNGVNMPHPPLHAHNQQPQQSPRWAPF